MAIMLLIAMSYLRQNRLLVGLIIVYPLLYGLLVSLQFTSSNPTDVMDLLHQEEFYAVVLSGIASVSALHNEIKSKRILMVLSKGITRSEFLAGLLLGILCLAGFYVLSLYASSVWANGTDEAGNGMSLTLAWALISLCFFTASMGVFFSTFLNPILATIGVGLVLSASYGLLARSGSAGDGFFPLASLVRTLMTLPVNSDSTLVWRQGARLWAESILVGGFACAIFQRRNVTVALE